MIDMNVTKFDCSPHFYSSTPPWQAAELLPAGLVGPSPPALCSRRLSYSIRTQIRARGFDENHILELQGVDALGLSLLVIL